MDQNNDLCELGSRIGGAIEDVKRSLKLADDLTGKEDSRDPGWPAMGVLIDQLEKILRMLEPLPGPEIEQAIQSANDYLDEMSDRADGISY